jgi:hypothetical protein
VSIRPHGTTQLPLVMKFDISGFLKKSLEKIQFLLKSDKTKQYFK